jgi:LmbE family N-acetylglucosaminyl deacetylase
MFVSATNGDIGHWEMHGRALADRRAEEVQKAAKILGTKTVVLDIHDGELMPTLENRRTFTRLIRNWKADIVIAHRPNDYHPDHRYTGVLMQDSAFMVAVPFFCPETPALDKNPVFLYSADNFQQPAPFRADVVVAIDAVIETKLDALLTMESQFVEGGALGKPTAPRTNAEREAKRAQSRENFARRAAAIADKYRDKLIELYGEQPGKSVKYAEAFEVCEYGRQPSPEELRELFPFLPNQD